MKNCGTQTIITKRLILRRLTESDADAMFKNWTSDPEVTRFLTWPTHKSVDVTKYVLGTWIPLYEKEDYYHWGITLKENGDEPIGTIHGLVNMDTDSVQIGYCLGRTWWHKGIMSEAAKAVVEFFFQNVQVNSICSYHDPKNPHSGMVMKHCGMKYEGTRRAADRNNTGICDASWYSILRSEYKGELFCVPQRVMETRRNWAENDAKRDMGLKEPETIEKFKDISYGPYGDSNILDVYRPAAKTEKFPVIVSIHGGGYFYGDKELYRFYCMHLAEYGFAVINFNYRLAPEYKFPAPLEDALAVFNWISKNADQYKLDKDRVFLVGDSAGAQLVSQFACICSNKEYADIFRFTLPEDVRLKGISLACGMYNIRQRTDGDNIIMLDYLGSLELLNDPRTEVHEYINSDYPPAFVFSAENDFLVTECKPFAEFLNQKSVFAKAKIYGKKEDTRVGHVFHVDMRLPEGEEANRDQIEFFMSL